MKVILILKHLYLRSTDKKKWDRSFASIPFLFFLFVSRPGRSRLQNHWNPISLQCAATDQNQLRGEVFL